MLYIPTLHVELIDTTVEDFAWHMIGQIESLFSIPIVEIKDETKWDETEWKVVVVDDEPDALGRKMTFLSFGPAKGTALVSVRIDQSGTTICGWEVYRGETDWTDHPAFMVYASHFQDKRLNVLVYEDMRGESTVGKLMLEWLERHWRTNVEQISLHDPPSERETYPPKRWQPRSEADKWLIEQYFNVHHERQGLTYFREEWLRLRRKELRLDPVDPDNRMAKIVGNERKARGG